MATALITGITGQDGYYLAQHLLEQGYTVYGLTRPMSPERAILEREASGIRLLPGDVRDAESLRGALVKAKPDEVYHLAAIGLGPHSFDDPALLGDVNGLGAARLLEAARTCVPDARIFYASSSEVYAGLSPAEMPVRETSPIAPRTPYGASKAYGQFLCDVYRRAYGLFIAVGVLFNHESPRRREEFVVRKVTMAAARAARGLPADLSLGNVTARRDWGWAPDYVRAMHLALQRAKPDTYIIATGEPHSVQELVEAAFAAAGLDWRTHVQTDSSLLRPSDADLLYGDPSKARQDLGWNPSVRFQEMVESLVRTATVTWPGTHVSP
ncbi:MAG: GDP-mannose 4,6-dehydratase [Chloroflexi bacterium]|nr:GDP-mannose 4,6-dehydratase [Chloroflexota bacterium]